MGRELDVLVAPLSRSIVAGDEPASMDSPEIAVDERVPGLRVVGRSLGQPEVPLGVLVPGM
jgi:hypothetical protein